MTVVPDDAERANETPLAGNWTIGTGDAGSWNLSNGLFVPSALGSDASAFYSGITWGNDQGASVPVVVTGTGAGSGPGVCLRRATGARTYYRATVSHAVTNTINIARYTANVFASLTSFTTPWNDFDVLTAYAIGLAGATTIYVYRNGVFIGSWLDSTGTITGGSPGLAYSSTVTAASLPSWAGYDLVIPSPDDSLGGLVPAGIFDPELVSKAWF